MGGTGALLNEAQTRSQLIDPALHARGWTEDLIRREETLGTVEIVDGRPRRASHGRTDYTLRVRAEDGTQPVAVAVLEAKSEDKHPAYGLDQAKGYLACKRLHVPFVAATNGHLWVLFDKRTGVTSQARPMAESAGSSAPALSARGSRPWRMSGSPTSATCRRTCRRRRA